MKVWVLMAELHLGPAGIVRTPVSVFDNESQAMLAHRDRIGQLNLLAGSELAERSPMGLVGRGAPAVSLLALCGVTEVHFQVIHTETVGAIVKPEGSGRIVVP